MIKEKTKKKLPTMEEVRYKISIESWGRAGWTFLKSIALLYPENPTEDEKKQYYDFFKTIAYILPCVKCRKHYDENFKTNPINLESRRTLAIWINDMENEVKKTSNKPLVPFTSFIAEYLPPSMYRTVNLTPEEMNLAGIQHQKIQKNPTKITENKESQHNIPIYFWILFSIACFLVLALSIKIVCFSKVK
jgi:hypothetical protein